MTTLAVHTFEIDPIWKIESFVTGAPVSMFLFSVPWAAVTTSSARPSPSLRMPSCAPGTLWQLRQRVEATLPVRRVDRRGARARGIRRVPLHPLDDARVVVDAVAGLARQREQVAAVGVEHETGRDAALAQRVVPLLRLPDRAAHVGAAVQHEGGRLHLVDLRVGRHRREAFAVLRLPRHRADLEDVHEVRLVGRAAHAGEIADHAARDGGGEPVVAAREVAGHVAAVAVAR